MSSVLNQINRILMPKTINVSIDDVFTSLESNPSKKPISLTEDPLVTSSTWYRLRQLNKGGAIESVTSTRLLSLIEPEDRIFADQIREHFSKKLMMLSLKGVAFSSFRNDLAIIISTDSKLIEEKYFPIYYRLPEFYVYDTMFNEMVVGLDTSKPISPLNRPEGITLTPLKKLATRKTNEYWFSDDEKKLFRLVVPNSNMLRHLLDKAYEKPIFFSKLYLKNKVVDGAWFLDITNFELG